MSRRLLAGIAARLDSLNLPGWNWTVNHPPGDARLIHTATWDSDGHCLAATTEGLEFWTGTQWQRPSEQSSLPHALPRFVVGVRPGLWLIGGARGSLALYGQRGLEPLPLLDDTLTLIHGSGDPDDIALLVGESPAGVSLHGISNRRRLAALTLDFAVSATDLARVGETRWLVTGRTHGGTGYVALVDPLEARVTRLDAPPTDALLACAAQPEAETAVVVGRDGAAALFDGDRLIDLRMHQPSDLAACSIDLVGRCWAASVGALWTRRSGADLQWTAAWSNNSWGAPFISLRADVGLVQAVTVDGAVVEGRSDEIAPTRLEQR